MVVVFCVHAYFPEVLPHFPVFHLFQYEGLSFSVLTLDMFLTGKDLMLRLLIHI